MHAQHPDQSVQVAPGVEPPRFLERVLPRLVRAFAPECIVLFGSYARGTAQPSSDVDLLVVADLEGDAEHHMRRARQLVADSFPPIDIILCSPDEVAEAHTARSPFLLSILGAGVTIYTRQAATSTEEQHVGYL
jgi:predicted nucleotidyltransferase